VEGKNKHLNQTDNGAILSDADIEIIRIVGLEKCYGDEQTKERGLIPVNIKFERRCFVLFHLCFFLFVQA
jgi:hypothetical protein